MDNTQTQNLSPISPHIRPRRYRKLYYKSVSSLQQPRSKPPSIHDKEICIISLRLVRATIPTPAIAETSIPPFIRVQITKHERKERIGKKRRHGKVSDLAPNCRLTQTDILSIEEFLFLLFYTDFCPPQPPTAFFTDAEQLMYHNNLAGRTGSTIFFFLNPKWKPKRCSHLLHSSPRTPASRPPASQPGLTSPNNPPSAAFRLQKPVQHPPFTTYPHSLLSHHRHILSNVETPIFPALRDSTSTASTRPHPRRLFAASHISFAVGRPSFRVIFDVGSYAIE